MSERRVWPFPIPGDVQQSEASQRQVTFFEKASRLGLQAFVDGPLLGATNPTGREGQMIPRRGWDRGLRKTWEVTLGQGDVFAAPRMIDGFENAANLVLFWLCGGILDATPRAEYVA